MPIDVARRRRLATDLLTALRAAAPGSAVLLRGSLAEGRADAYSDIDLLWDVPDDDFPTTIAKLPTILARVRPAASLRYDPDFQRSSKRRLAFIRFAGTPLFWRVDLDIFARSTLRDPDFDRDNPSALGAAWSATESALMNAVAAIKALRRGNHALATDLLDRAEQRVGAPVSDSDVDGRILALVNKAAIHDVKTAPLTADVRQLVTTLH